jgi:hypothetical protein
MIGWVFDFAVYWGNMYIYCTCTYKELSMATAAIERIVVQATAQEKKFISAKAKKLGLPVSELMRRGATAYNSADADEALGILADAAMSAANRASDSIDNVVAFVAESEKRIAAMESKAAERQKGRKAA